MALAFALIAIGLGLAAVSLLGPFVTGVIDYHVSATLRNQTIGLDAVSLVLVAPLSILAGVLAMRGHVAGPPLALGVGAYTAYMLVQYVLGPAYLTYPGNNELLFPLYLVLFVLGWAVVIVAWNTIDVDRLPRSVRLDRLVSGVVLPVLASLAFFRYLPALVDAMGDATDSGYVAGPTFFWAIATMDLGIFLPATVLTCFGLLRGWEWAQKAVYAVVGWFGLVGPAVAGMAVAMHMNDDPNSSGAAATFMVVVGLGFATLAFWLFRPLLRRRSAARAKSRGGVLRALGDVIRAAPLFVTAPLFRRRHLRWGATDEELEAEMPGGELVPDASFNATRAITIDASPAEVWPWLVQVGFGRAGFYSYDLFDNAARPSAERIIPELGRARVAAEVGCPDFVGGGDTPRGGRPLRAGA